jgi:hypothetical protein
MSGFMSRFTAAFANGFTKARIDTPRAAKGGCRAAPA